MNLWVRLENFSGGAVAPASGAATTSASALPTLPSAAQAPTYAYLKAATETLTDQLHDVVVYRGRPGAGGMELCRQSAAMTSVEAAANKVTGATGPSSATLGGTFTHRTPDRHRRPRRSRLEPHGWRA